LRRDELMRGRTPRLGEKLALAGLVILMLLGLGMVAVGLHSRGRSANASAQVLTDAHPAAGQFHANATMLSRCQTNGSFGCYEQAFGNIAFRQGPNKAFAELSTLLARNLPAVRADCHTITHLIGSATLARFHGNAAAAMGDGQTTCGSGFYHGLIEYALRGTSTRAQLVQKVKGLCSNRRALTTTFARYQCLHGLGHGVMIFSGDNLPWALSICDVLGNRWSEQSCSGGVFMQNFNLPDKLSPFQSQYVKKSDLLYPCDWVRTKFKFYCYLQITEHILYATNYDWKRTAAACASAPKPWSGICFQSFGRDASGYSNYHAAVANRYCHLTGTHLADCVYGVARDFTNNDANGSRAAGFCRLQTTSAMRGYCFYAVGTILDTLGGSSAALATRCAELTSRYAGECAGKLNIAEYKLITPMPG
jgi:hypothetical protein